MIYQNETTMKTIISNSYAKVVFNGSKTYMVIDSANQCHFATDTEKKAINRFKRICKDANVN